MALSTDLSIVSFPAQESLFGDELIAFCRILSTIEVNKSPFLLPKCSRSPRYLPKRPSCVIPSNNFVFSLTSGGDLLENVMDDLALLII